MYTLKELNEFGLRHSDQIDICWERFEKDSTADAHIKRKFEEAKIRLATLEPIYENMRMVDTRINDDCLINEELDICIHEIEDMIVDAYAMLAVYERYNLVNSITSNNY